MASTGNEEGEFGLQIAPMLDVMFVLLLFFMVSAGQVVKETELGVQIPTSGKPGEPTTPSPITININEDGTILFNTASIATPDDIRLQELRERLRLRQSTRPLFSAPEKNLASTPSRGYQWSNPARKWSCEIVFLFIFPVPRVLNPSGDSPARGLPQSRCGSISSDASGERPHRGAFKSGQ